MKELTDILRKGNSLTPEEIREACKLLLDETRDIQQRADFLHALHTKGETAQEIACFADTMLEMAVPFPLDKKKLAGPLIDVCGTGGDGKDFFNVSTCVMFVVAACGAKVVKHGNRSVSSQCGSADVLEAMGVPIHRSPEEALLCLERCGAVFLFASDYYPVFKAVAPVRKMLGGQGIRTVFNILGPLINPAVPDYQLVGIFSSTLLEVYASTLSKLGRKRAWVVCGKNGEDEISITGETDAAETQGDTPRKFVISPKDLGFAKVEESTLYGGDAKQNALVLEGILNGSIEDGRRDIVSINAGAALVIAGIASDLGEGILLAKKALCDGSAWNVLKAMRV
ncbi:MAG: anthranilate phosphoribosyltransferase [Chthoniobacterales bacterium]